MSTAAVSVPSTRAQAKRSSLRRSRRWALVASYVFLILFAIFFLIPPYYMVVTAFKSDAEVARMATNPWIIADGVTLDQFKILFTNTDFLIFFKNTAIVTVCVVCITMVVSVLAAFSLGRMRFWGSGLLATGIFLTYLVPDTLLFIPLFQIVKAVGLLNSYWGMVLVYPTLTVPFCTWIMIGYFQSIPKELDEAALIDGAGHMQMLTKIFIPVALPGIIAATIFAFTVSWAAFVYPIAAAADPLETAPLLCAGIIGYRALTRAQLPPGGTLGIYGFGSSAHVTAQLAMAGGARVFAMTRGEGNRELARELGAAFVGGEDETPPEPLDAAIVFAPAGGLVPVALQATTGGGTVVLAGIEMSDIPSLGYTESLFRERDLRTVTANTREDGARFLAVAANLRLRPTVTAVPFDGLADAIDDLRRGRASGSLVLRVAE